MRLVRFFKILSRVMVEGRECEKRFMEIWKAATYPTYDWRIIYYPNGREAKVEEKPIQRPPGHTLLRIKAQLWFAWRNSK